MSVNQQQARYLRGRLDQIRRDKPSLYEPLGDKEPRTIKTARRQMESANKVVNRWEESQRKKREVRQGKIRKAVDKCRRAIEFGEAKAALKALDEFENSTF